MKMTMTNTIAAVAALTVASIASAQQLSSVATAEAWTVFSDPSNAKHCYVVSPPVSTKAFRDGSEVSVNRGDIRLYVGVKNGATEPSFVAGYPLKSNAVVEAKIGGAVYNFFTNPSANVEYAWPSPANDSALIRSMKGGAEVEVTGMSQRGTKTVDVFSLTGFTAAFNKAVETCK